MDFHLTLNDGDKAVIIGEEGNGKSTILKWLRDPAMVEEYVEAHGTVDLGRHVVAYLPQELPRGDREKTLYEFYSEEEWFFDATPKDLAALAKQYSLDADFFYSDQKLGTLSGGEKVKAQLMRLLISRPTVLLLDEPSNDLDIPTLEWLEHFINVFDGIVLFVSHDETLIERTANMVVHLELIDKKTKSRYTVSKTPYAQYIRERRRRMEKQAQMAISDLREKKIRDEKYRRIYQSVEYAQDTVSRGDPATARLLKKKMHSIKSMGRRFEKQDAEMTEMPEEEEAIFFLLGGEESRMPRSKEVLDFSLDVLRVSEGGAECSLSENSAAHGAARSADCCNQALSSQTSTPADPAENTNPSCRDDSHTFRSTDCGDIGNDRILARNIRLIVKGAEKVCIVGKNGCGKSTLFKKIAEELRGKSGIRIEVMPQNYEDLLPLDLSPVEYLAGDGGKEEKTRISTYLGSLKFTYEEMNRPVARLSGGQKAKIFLLKMSLSDANVLLLDEPTRNFSPLSAPVIREALKSFPGAIISISHDRRYIEEVCDKVYRLEEGGLYEGLEAAEN